MIQKVKAYIRFLDELACVNRNEWQIAIRKRNGKTLYQGNDAPFRLVRNSLRYWRADPFLFRYRGQDYLFAEMFDRWTEKGVLGVCKIRNGRCGRFRVCLELPWHLSYPCVFEDDQGIHMVPECYQSEEVWMYRCVKFPYRWEKEKLLLKGCAVDTTPGVGKNGRFWLTTRFASTTERYNDNLWQLNEAGEEPVCLRQKDPFSRGAGHLIPQGEDWIRPGQNCRHSYGSNLVFYRGWLENGVYREEPILAVYPPGETPAGGDLAVRCRGLKETCSGIHTYNAGDRYEVIDLRFSGRKSMVTMTKRLLAHIRGKRK